MITIITLFVVFDGLDIQSAAIGAPRCRAGRLFCVLVATAIGMYHLGTHGGGCVRTWVSTKSEELFRGRRCEDAGVVEL